MRKYPPIWLLLAVGRNAFWAVPNGLIWARSHVRVWAGSPGPEGLFRLELGPVAAGLACRAGGLGARCLPGMRVRRLLPALSTRRQPDGNGGGIDDPRAWRP